MTQAIPSPVTAAGGPATAPGKPANLEALRDVAQQFEAVFLAQVLSRINQGSSSDQTAGEGGEQTLFHDMFNDEVAKLISRSGGVGVADAVLKEMLKVQEVA